MNRFAGLGWFVALGLLALLLAPVVVLAGDPVLQRHRRGSMVRGQGAWLAAQNYRLNLAIFQFSMHPIVIALTAPARWARPQLRALRRRVRWLLRSRAARRRGWDGLNERLFPDDPGLSGVREPRRPNPMPPADAVALCQPTEHD